MPLAGRHGGERRDEVVGLVTLDLDERDGSASRISWTSEICPRTRSGSPTEWPCSRRTSRAEGAPRDVEGHRDVGGRLVAQQVDEHRGEAVDGIGVLAGLRGEVLGRQRVERAIGERMAVEQQEPGHVWQPRAHDRQHSRRAQHPRRAYLPVDVRPGRLVGCRLDQRDRPGALHDRMGVRLTEAGPAGSWHDAGRGQHPALRLAARRCLGGPRRRPGVDPRGHHWPARVARRSGSRSTPPTTGRRPRASSPAWPRRSRSDAAWVSYEIVITDDQGRRTCTCRFTCSQLRDAPPSR
jgi:hypothetical protein